jgi:hypothetical protein
VNNIRVLFNNQSKDLVIPIEQVWDFQGQDQAIETYEAQVIGRILNSQDNFEVNRFEHKEYDGGRTSANYEFYLYNPTTDSWANSYTGVSTTNQIYYFEPGFTKSFWKIDFYDSPTTRTQKNYITIILPVQQGLTQTTTLNGGNVVEIKRPTYVLDYIGDKEGFFIYWLKSRQFLDISTFYMTAKFFNGNTGEFIKMMTTEQSTMSNPYDFSPEEYFYYKVDLDYETQTYQVFNYPNGDRVGTISNPIKWYEYLNP